MSRAKDNKKELIEKYINPNERYCPGDILQRGSVRYGSCVLYYYPDNHRLLSGRPYGSTGTVLGLLAGPYGSGSCGQNGAEMTL